MGKGCGQAVLGIIIIGILAAIAIPRFDSEVTTREKGADQERTDPINRGGRGTIAAPATPKAKDKVAPKPKPKPVARKQAKPKPTKSHLRSTFEVARDLTVISESYSRARRKQFEKWLSGFVEMCPEIDDAATAGDRLAYINRMLKEGGLISKEEMFAFTDGIYGMTKNIYVRCRQTGMEMPECTTLWSGYQVSRLNGFSPEDSRGAITAMFIDFRETVDKALKEN